MIRSSRAKKDAIVRSKNVNVPRIHRVNDPKTWPPGAFMVFKSADFFGLGFVIANHDNIITVIWDANCKKTFSMYLVENLNPSVVSCADKQRKIVNS